MVEKIVLNDGTEIEGGIISVSSSNQIMVIIPGTNLVDNIIMLSDMNKTQVMEFYYSIYKETYTGYVSITSTAINTDKNETHIYMTGENPSHKREFTVSDLYAPKDLRKDVSENA